MNTTPSGPTEVDDLRVARMLAEAGLPVFVAPPNPSYVPGQKDEPEFLFPSGWARMEADPRLLDRWQPGWAVCLVTGHGLDGVDVDPLHGGDVQEQLTLLTDLGATVIGRVDTPSGGAHLYVMSTGIASSSNTRVGVDFRGGCDDGSGRGFLYLPGTQRPKHGGLGYSLRVDLDLTTLKTLTPDTEHTALVRYFDSLVPGVRPVSQQAPLVPASEPVHIESLPPQLRELLVEYGPTFTLVDGTTSTDRSARFHHLVAACQRSGLSLGQTVTLVDAWCAGVGLYPNRVGQEVARSWAKVSPDVDEDMEKRIQQLLSERRAKQIADERWAEETKQATEWVEPVAYTGTAFLAAEVGEPNYLVEGLWPRGGNVVLAARAKTGKTTFALNLVRCLLTGQPFLDEFAVDQVAGTICIIDLELSSSMLRSWMGDLDLGNDRLLVVPARGEGGWLAQQLADPSARSKLAAWLRGRSVEVLIIDPLSALLAGAGIEENSNSEVGRLLRGQLDALVEEAGISELMVVHHAGHGADRARGASALLDWPDATWTYSLNERERGDDDELDARQSAKPRFFTAVGRDVAFPKTPVSYDPDTRRLALNDPTVFLAEKRAASGTATEAKVLLALEQLGGKADSDNQLCREVGGNTKDYRDARDRLVTKGAVVRVSGRTRTSHGYALADR